MKIDEEENCGEEGCSICRNPVPPFPPIMFMFAAALLLFAAYACIKIHERSLDRTLRQRNAEVIIAP